MEDDSRILVLQYYPEFSSSVFPQCLKVNLGFQTSSVARNCAQWLLPLSPFHCAIIAKKEAIKYLRNFAELHATELLFHLKINNFMCDLQSYAADTRMEISLDLKKNRVPSVTCFNSFRILKFLVVKLLINNLIV